MLFDKLDRSSRSKNRRNRSFPRSRPPIVQRGRPRKEEEGKKGKSIDEAPSTSVVPECRESYREADRVARFQTLNEGWGSPVLIFENARARATCT